LQIVDIIYTLQIVKTFEEIFSVLGRVLACLLELGCYQNNGLGASRAHY
jgi:hypothetical protein